MKKKLRQYLKMIVQNGILPVAYRLFCIQRVQGQLVVLADGHRQSRPPSMQELYEGLCQESYEVSEWYCDFQAMSYGKALWRMLQFMHLYARAGFVVISDNFLPVASCKKRPQTFVIQLWHGCGAFKKFGYDTGDDIPADYIGNVFRNYDLVPVSGNRSVAPFTSAMRLREGVCRPIGVSATDRYFDKDYETSCRQEFLESCPGAEGKKILLWAPTFRGSASDPVVPGSGLFEKIRETLKEEWFVIIKYHPHMEAKGFSSTLSIPTERLLPVTDMLVTDYSSILFLYAIYNRPFLLFAPDLEEYAGQRGFYLDYADLPGECVQREEELVQGIRRAQERFDPEAMRRFYKEYMSGCDGRATQRILDIMDKKREQL
ncbi:MAG: CDP-glycerol glycerophosphotransferase family protein [Lachnospiraceae bacterium]|nr:CDP-glycerol glycerophosphotransferase family protein [Lachnospiraceae bacterium]